MLNPFTEPWHTGDLSFDFWLACEVALVLSTALGTFTQAPYGKLANDTFGAASLSPRLGWWLMELPATVSFLATFFLTPRSPNTSATTSAALAAVWVVHYGNRGWYFPLNIRVAPGTKTSFGLIVSVMGAVFTALHGHLNARMFRELGRHYTDDWIRDPRFMVGLGVWIAGFLLLVHSEHVIRELRPKDGAVAKGQPRYKIPRGGGFEFVTSPQYLGELVAWAGFTLLTWSLPGAMVLLISLLNLVPRAFHNHTWYCKKFGGEYEALGRRRLVPFCI